MTIAVSEPLGWILVGIALFAFVLWLSKRVR